MGHSFGYPVPLHSYRVSTTVQTRCTGIITMARSISSSSRSEPVQLVGRSLQVLTSKPLARRVGRSLPAGASSRLTLVWQ